MFTDRDTDIFVPPISGINGIDLRNSLNAKFGGARTAGAKYTLAVNLAEPTTQYKGLDPTGAANWQEINVRASYVLSCDGNKIASGSEMASESYTFVRYLVASNAAYNNAVQNAISQLADKISVRVIVETSKYERENPE